MVEPSLTSLVYTTEILEIIKKQNVRLPGLLHIIYITWIPLASPKFLT